MKDSRFETVDLNKVYENNVPKDAEVYGKTVEQ